MREKNPSLILSCVNLQMVHMKILTASSSVIVNKYLLMNNEDGDIKYNFITSRGLKSN